MLEKESASHVNSSETSLHGRRNIEHISCTETNDFSVLKLVLSHFVDLERLLSQRNLTNVNPTGISMSLLTNATLFLMPVSTASLKYLTGLCVYLELVI